MKRLATIDVARDADRLGIERVRIYVEQDDSGEVWVRKHGEAVSGRRLYAAVGKGGAVTAVSVTARHPQEPG